MKWRCKREKYEKVVERWELEVLFKSVFFLVDHGENKEVLWYDRGSYERNSE
jgi:hypothetical protein